MAKLNEFLDKKNIFAVVGATNNKEKYGNKVFLDLKNKGCEVYPINPNEESIEGFNCYKSLSCLSRQKECERIVAIIIVPPKITELIVEECEKIGIGKVWMQPGAESDKAINFCKKTGIKCIHNMCIMVEKQ